MTHQDKSISTKRTSSRLNSKLEKNLWAYAAAATAAGVGLFSGPQAEAKIVYTPANTTLWRGTPEYSLDLNHDFIVDFYLNPSVAVSIGGSTRWSYLQVCHVLGKCVSSTSAIQSNADNVVRVGSTNAAADLPAGARIGDGVRFAGTGKAVIMGEWIYHSAGNTATGWNGPWMNGGKGVKNRYLGLKFKIDGEFHFGWARLTIKTIPQHGYRATLTGYAYETTANKSILAGQINGPDDTSDLNPTAPIIPANPAYRPASLGMLGLGAEGLSAWRREEN
jgi:hypothetical protein